MYISRRDMKSKKNMILSAIFSLCWMWVKYLPSPWFDSFRYIVLKIFCRKCESSYIGENITIFFPWNISIGKHVSINNNCYIDGTGGITIKDGTRIAANVCFWTADHDYDAPKKIYQSGFVVDEIIVDENVWIGANSQITKGVHIEADSVIACASCVTKNVSSRTMVGGVPAKVIKAY